MQCAAYVVQFFAYLCTLDIFSTAHPPLSLPKDGFGRAFVETFLATQACQEWKQTLTLSGKFDKITRIIAPRHPAENGRVLSFVCSAGSRRVTHTQRGADPRHAV